MRAVRSLSYQVNRGEVLGIVGESGSGKTVSSLAVMDLLPPHARVTGSVRFEGRELIGRSDRELSEIRGRRIAMIFQDPLSALTPVYTVGDQIAEAILVHQDVSRGGRARRAIELLDAGRHSEPEPARRGVPARVLRRHAAARDDRDGHRERSGADHRRRADDGARRHDPGADPRRAAERRAKATGAAILLITHDLGVVAGFADRVAVMYAGKLVETGAVDDVFYRPRMPYTLGLLGSMPRPDRASSKPLTPIEGNPPSLV